MRKLKEHAPLSELTTMRVGGPARYFYVAKNVSEIKEVLSFAENNHMPVFILGGGSNIVVSDDGFNGLVLKPDIRGVHIEEAEDGFTATFGAGENWDACVEAVVSKNIFGIENLSAIPGTVGAAPVQNIGAYGVELKDFIASIEAVDIRTRETITLSRESCLFSYRDSIFKQNKGRHLVITNVTLWLSKERGAVTDYKSVSEYVVAHNLDAKTLFPEDMRRIIIEIRTRKMPDMREVGTVGSFFKNPIISKEKFLALSHIYRGLPGYDTGDGKMKVPLAWIIDNVCKKKGFRKNNVGVHDKQALVLVNFGGGTACDIKEFADEIRNDVQRHTGIEVEFEISFVGEF